MGATIDYAILFTSYYVENRNYFKLGVNDRAEAVTTAIQRGFLAT
jgi:DNA-binding CsgD family transcriptional regulator